MSHLVSVLRLTLCGIAGSSISASAWAENPALSTQPYGTVTIAAPSATATYATALNDDGVVVGYAMQPNADPNLPDIAHGYAWSAGVFTTIEPPGAYDSLVFGVGNDGTIVGEYQPDTAHGYAAFGLRKGVYSTAARPGNDLGLVAVNKTGAAIGNVTPSGSEGTRAGLFFRSGSFAQRGLPSSFPGMLRAVTALNDTGSVVGDFAPAQHPRFVRGFVASSGGIVALPGSLNSDVEPRGINNHNAVVGFISNRASEEGFLYSAGNLQVLKAPGATRTAALGINDAGDVVGDIDPGSTGGTAFVLHQGIYSPISPVGSIVSYASAINASGQIVGFSQDAGGTTTGFLATPLP